MFPRGDGETLERDKGTIPTRKEDDRSKASYGEDDKTPHGHGNNTLKIDDDISSTPGLHPQSIVHASW